MKLYYDPVSTPSRPVMLPQFAESADLRETMQGFGVIDKPDIYFLKR